MKRSYTIFAALLAGYLLGNLTQGASAHEEGDCEPPPPCPVCGVGETRPDFDALAQEKKAEAIRTALEAIEAAENPPVQQVLQPLNRDAQKWEE